MGDEGSGFLGFLGTGSGKQETRTRKKKEDARKGRGEVLSENRFFNFRHFLYFSCFFRHLSPFFAFIQNLGSRTGRRESGHSSRRLISTGLLIHGSTGTLFRTWVIVSPIVGLELKQLIPF